MERKIVINFGGIAFEADLADASFVMSEPLGEGVETLGPNIFIDESSKRHQVFGYTTDISTMRLIFQNRTIRSSSLSYAKLNDTMEKQRVGVSDFACSRFITCFTHTNQESVPFWMNYGKDVPEDKLLLRFSNFTHDLGKKVRTDFVKVKDDKLCFFKAPEYGKTINQQLSCDGSIYDLRACVDSLSVFDVEYVEPGSPVFTEDYSGEVDIDFGRITGQPNTHVKVRGYNPTVLGKQKSNPWDYEKETRILCTLSDPHFSEWEYLDLRLFDEFFRDLRIVLSPWDDGTLRAKVEDIIQNSGLPIEIANSITIVDSVLKGTLNF